MRHTLRLQAIERAHEAQWATKRRTVERQLATAYEQRLGAVVRKAEEKARIEQQRLDDALRAKREATRKKKEKELDQELLSTLEDGGGPPRRGRGGTGRGRGRGGGRGGRRSAAAAAAVAAAAAATPVTGEDGEADELDDDDGANSSAAIATPTRNRGKKRKLEDTPADVSVVASDRGTPIKTEGAAEEMQSAAADLASGAVDQIPDPDGPARPLDAKRIKYLEDAHRRIWVVMARKEIPKVHRIVQSTISARNAFTKRVATVAQREARRAEVRNNKTTKDIQQRARKAMREMLVFWRRNEKEEKELRRKAEKEAADRLRKEEEMREAKRQARKLNFLITQTELYSHFVGNKLRTSEAEDSEETSGSSKVIDGSTTQADAPASIPPVDPSTQHREAAAAGAAEGELRDIDFDDEDESNLRAHAARNAQEAVLAAKEKAKAFDALADQERRKVAGSDALPADGGRTIEEKDLGKAFDSDDLNFQNPTSMGQMNISQPKMLTCMLKEYQLKGLNWLANLYEQGINGILADEMGLGKTVQSISLMSYLAEVHDIWGPFLVIAPSSTLHNWQQEISKFTPSLKALPYWGSVKDRTVLRKFWNKKHMSYNRDSPFHVLVTSYQLVVTDEKYFKRVNWQYMILDEAQAIKSSQSTRWRTLLSFNCRNRLLLTGTPVQNSMQELWALLHFIMPSLFDSHDEFSEWFSKDIEGHAENKGTLNEGQLRRLHMILKPFMLRRIKKNVQNELGDKIEIDVMCEMSARQKMLYRGLRENVSIAELMDRASNLHDEAGLKHLMNLVMQFRKVCNHPELFERADVSAPFQFGRYAQSASLSREGDLLYCPDSITNVIEYQLPKLLVREGGLLGEVGPNSKAGLDTKYLNNLLNIWREGHIARSLQEDGSAFAALRIIDATPREAERAFHGHTAAQIMQALDTEERYQSLEPYLSDKDFAASSVKPFGRVTSRVPRSSGVDSGMPALHEVQRRYAEQSSLSKPEARVWQGPVLAPPIQAYSNDRPFVVQQEESRRDQIISDMLLGIPRPYCEDEHALHSVRSSLPGLPARGILAESSVDQLPPAQMQVPQINKLIIDSSKLAHLDKLLRELKANDHRVLIYFQMTKMIDLMEEYLIYRQHKYLRLDGSSKISDRRDMVTDWQTKPEIFVFLLSTRAGGLGINLTAADTVIFFDSDWNPSNDQQAMDRAHRLGQTKQVTVYRLITKGTIDERIIKMARSKKEVQDMVVGNKTYNEAGLAKPQEIVSLLMDDDELADAMLRRRQAEEAALAQGKADTLRETHRKRRLNKEKEKGSPMVTQPSALDWTLEDDEDDFFGAKPPPKIEELDAPSGRGSPAINGTGGKRKKLQNNTGVPKGTPAGGPNAKKKPRNSGAVDVTDNGQVEGTAGEATHQASAPKKPRKSAGAGKKVAGASGNDEAAAAQESSAADTSAPVSSVAAPATLPASSQ